MHKDFFVHIITRKPSLFRAILRFNGLTEDTAAPDCLTAMPGVDAQALWALPQVRKRLSVAPDATECFWDFTEEKHRLALLEPETLLRAARFFGMAAHAEELAGKILGEEVRSLRRSLGTEWIRYALERGRFQLGTLAQVFALRDRHLSLPERIELHGRQVLELCCAQWPPLLRRRATEHTRLFRAHHESTADEDALENDLSGQPETVRRALWFGFKKILLKEVAPQWAACFD
jgi:hypothetical protein